jgi:hypothetical protein
MSGKSTPHDADGPSLGGTDNDNEVVMWVSAMGLCLLVEAGLPEGSTFHYDAVGKPEGRIRMGWLTAVASMLA